MFTKGKLTLAILGALTIVLLIKSQTSTNVKVQIMSEEDQAIADVYSAWKLENKRLYASPQEDSLRFGIFKENYKLIEETNSKNLGFTLGINPTADLTYEEFATEYKLFKKGDPLKDPFAGLTFQKENSVINQEEFEREIQKRFSLSQGQMITQDWQNQKRYNPSRNMGNCKVANLFAVVSALESSYAIKRNEM